MATLAQQLVSVQTAIAAIESGAQATSSEGESLTRPSLETLYKREEHLLDKVNRADRGNITVMET